MRVEKILLRDFRCYEEAEVNFDPSVNIICGENAAGKTNLLESVYYFSAMKPLRAVRERETVRYGAEVAYFAEYIQNGCDGSQNDPVSAARTIKLAETLRESADRNGEIVEFTI